jgi:hypothetical protein
MPNWCENTITIKGKAQQVNDIYQRLIKDDAEEGLCSILYPQPKDMFTGNLGQKEREECQEKGIPNWYDWQTSNWGTKWDTCDGDWKYEDADDGEAILTGNFQTAWGPPIGVYEHAQEAHPELYIYAMYYECGCAFAGIWETDFGEDHYSLEGTKKDLEEQLPEELNDAFGITENMEEEPEELSEWINDALEAKRTKEVA